MHRKTEDVDDARPFREGIATMGYKYVLGLPIAVLKLISDGIRVFLRKTDKQT
jgi:hypothetical protein